MHNDLQDVKQALKDRIEDVCQKLLPDGRRDGGVWLSHNPMVSDDARHLPALKVGLVREKGAWRCWRHGDKGDVIKLIEFTQNTDLKGALQWARDFLGLRAMSFAERAAMRQAGEAKRKREAELNRLARANKLDKAKELFFVRAAAIGGAAEMHARKYFAGRGCALEDVAHLNRETFRFSQASEWWKGARWGNRDGHKIKSEEGPRFPAIHTGMRTAAGIVTCCHVTFLDPLLPQKAPVEPPKLMYGEALGAVIEVSTGPLHSVPFWHDNPLVPQPLILCEGIETALSLAIAIPDTRVWAAGSLAGMGSAPIELPCISDVTVARDNNHGNPQAQAQLAGALAKLEAHGKQLVVMNSHVGDDFNDLIKGEAHEREEKQDE